VSANRNRKASHSTIWNLICLSDRNKKMIEIIYTTEAAARAYGEEAPQYGSAGAAAFDLRAMIDAPMTILPAEQKFIPTGIRLNMAEQERAAFNLAAIALPRSGRGSKEGLVLGNTAGLIDEDFQGEIMLCAWARPTDGHINAQNYRIGGRPIHIEPGERVAQLMFIPVLRPQFKVVTEFSKTTERGAGGFGSTGK
jgi:dUTP pyrophosphatase